MPTQITSYDEARVALDICLNVIFNKLLFESSFILKSLYIDGLSNGDIQSKLNIGHSKYYDLKNKALIQFELAFENFKNLTKPNAKP